MSRFVRASKYRHVFGQPGKKETCIENVKVTNSAWDTNIISASASYISVNWNSSGGGAFAILPLPSPFSTIQSPSNFPHKLPDTLPLARSHTAPVLDTAWAPHDDSIVASGGEDGKLIIWKVEDPSVFDGWGTEGYVPKDFDPLLRIDASARKVGQVDFHPTASNVLASASGDHVVKLWDLANPESPRSSLTGHTDAIQSIAFNRTGTLLATTARDKKLRMFDPRAGGTPVRVADSHTGIKGSRVVWAGDLDIVATTGFSKMSERQVGLWETGGLTNVKMLPIDQSAGVIMPFWSDNNVLFLAGKGDGNIRYLEYESNNLVALDEFSSSVPQRGMTFLPRRALNVSDCEIARAYKIHGTTVEPIAFIVPRKSDSFQSDIYPLAPSKEPSATADEFFSGNKEIRAKMLDLGSGGISTSAAAPAPSPVQVKKTESAPAPTPASAPAPTPAAPAPAKQSSLPTPEPISKSVSEPSAPPTPVPAVAPPSNDAEVSALRSQLSSAETELRDARKRIRELELEVETVKANARKAAEAFASLG